MGLLDKLLGGKKLRSAIAESLQNSSAGMRFFLVARLKDFYSQQGYGDEAMFLSIAIVNYAVALEDDVDREGSDEAKQYKAQKHELIRSEAAKICFQTPDVVQVLSYLYAAEVLYLGNLMGSGGDKKWAVGKISELSERASELGVGIPNQHEICGKPDSYSCVQALAAFVNDLPLDHLFSELAKGRAAISAP
jgi:hypothetical protein